MLLGYNKICLYLSVNSGQPSDSITAALNRYLAIANDPSEVNWEFVAQAYMRLGNYAMAINALHKHSTYNDLTADDAYYYLMSETCHSLGDYQQAYDNLVRYSDISDSLDMIKMRQEVNSVKENFEKELLIQKQHWLLCISALLF